MLAEQEYTLINELESTHWWYKSLHYLTLRAIESHYGKQKSLAIIDAGCGTGGLIQLLEEKGYWKVEGFDLSPIAVEHCQRKYQMVFEGDISTIDSYYKDDKADVIICNDTLYFFNEEKLDKIFHSIYQLLKPGGILIANVPALKSFRGNHDLQVNITKRYKRGEIIPYLTRRGFGIEMAEYWPFLLSPAIWMTRRIKSLASTPIARSDLKKEKDVLNDLLAFVTRKELQFMRKKPFGSSLFIVAKKP